MSNDVINPSHYKLPNGKEVIDILWEELSSEEFRGYLKGNAIKYAMRHGKKQHIDAAMAQQFLEMLPSGNVALLKDDVVSHFIAWQKVVNTSMEDADMKKRHWYEDRLHRLGEFVGGIIARLILKNRG